jgi:hypothetical protein
MASATLPPAVVTFLSTVAMITKRLRGRDVDLTLAMQQEPVARLR